MAISTNSTFIILPGVDTTMRTNMDIAITNNPTVLAVLLASGSTTQINTINTSVTTVRSKIDNLPSLDPYPTFALWSNYQNNPGYVVYDSNMQPLHGNYMNTDFEIQASYNGWNYTTNNFGSGGWGSTNWVSATCMNQAEGNWIVQLPGGSGGGAAWNNMYGRNPGVMNNIWPFFGVVVGAKGKRQKISLFQSNASIGVYPRGGMAPIEQLALNTTTYANWFGGTGYGMIGYNDRTRELVVVEAKDGSNNYRIHFWRNTDRPLNVDNFDCGTLHLFLSEAKTAGTPAALTATKYYYYNEFQWQQDSSQNWNESRYRMRIIVGDNDYIGMARYTPSNATRYATFLPNPAGTAGTLQTLNGVGHTTSYGWDQGQQYGQRHVISWSNNWVVSYAPYYYYGSGMCAIVSDTRDPRRYYTFQQTQTSNGCQTVPFKEDMFLFNDSANNPDGNVGFRLWTYDPEGYMLNGRSQTGAVTNGQQINMQNNTFTYSFDTRYTSTNYPTLMSTESWSHF